MRELSEQEREACLIRAGYNVFNLDPEDLEIDIYTDIPVRSFVAPIRDAGLEAGMNGSREPDLQSRAEALYGPARYVATSRGRSAEFALVAALEKKDVTVLTQGLFKTTERALLRAGCKVEVGPRARDGTSDLDMDYLEKRFAAGGVAAVYLEASNNQLGGWPLHLDHMLAVKRLCQQNNALLLLDATRLLANCAALDGSVIETAQQFCAASDAFAIACAKEILVPTGGLVGVRNLEQQRRAFASAFFGGYGLEPLEARVRLARGLEYVKAHPEVITQRRQLLLKLADRLRELHVPILEPIGGHAVYVIMDSLVDDPAKVHGLEGLLYRFGGMRAWLSKSSLLGKYLLRLILAPGCFDESHVERIALTLRKVFDRASEAPALVEKPGGEHLTEHYMHFMPRA